jgi:ATP-binding cassette subfamily B protein
MYHGYSEFRNNRSSLGELVANYRDTLDYYWQLCDDKDTIIEWKDIHVHYSNNSVVLPNLTLKRGDHVLLRGPSGSGKSTFVRLILGQVNKVHGYLARSKDELAVSLCEQSALLFPGSVLFNITFRDSLDDVNLERLEAVCEAVCIFDFVKDLAGLATSEIDSMGSNFSGGQKQRIALARTLFIRAEVYIFDEATSALNTELQNKIYKNILSYLEDSTSIHVSHQEEVFSLFSKQIEFNDKF